MNIHKYKQRMPATYNLPNLLQALRGTTKMSPIFFMTWMELFQCDFTLTVYDNGGDRDDPLKQPITFDSRDGKIHHPNEESGEKKEGEHETKNNMPRSTRQFD